MKEFWESVWKGQDLDRFESYINLEKKYIYIDFFKKYNINKVCDVGCGFGKYSIISGFNGFEIWGCDLANKAIEITKHTLDRIGLRHKEYKQSNILDIEFNKDEFDGSIAHTVIEYVKYKEAEKAIEELSRITKKDGLIYVAFGGLEQDDINMKHIKLDDGTFIYKEGKRKGMQFRFYNNEEIRELLSNHKIIYFDINAKKGRDVIFINQK